MDKISALNSSASLRAKSLFPDAVEPIIANCFMMTLYQRGGRTFDKAPLKSFYDKIKAI
jgi:hypothetical protein